jgi:dipeptidase E
MQLFLSGGGEKEDSIELDKLFVDVLDKRKPLLYIPVAGNLKRIPHSERLKWLHSVFDPLDRNDITMWTELEGKTFKNLNEFSGIYIGGGNTFRLWKEIKDSHFDKLLQKACDENIPIYGGSAGAIILAKTLIPALSADKNEVGISNFDALNKVNNFEVWCHYTQKDNEIIVDYMKKYKLNKVIALPENGGLQVDNSAIRAIGPGQVVLFNKDGKKLVQPGELIQ